MHPVGLALPVVLAWQWAREEQDRKKGLRLLIGILVVTAIFLFARWGWYGMDAAADNPLTVLGDAILGSPLLHTRGWGVGLIILDLLIIAIGMHLYRRNRDSVSLFLIAGSLIGLLHPDHVWTLIAWAATLYLLLPLLIEANTRYGWKGIVGQRGLVLLLVMLTATIAMIHGKAYGAVGKLQLKNESDSLIAVLAGEAEQTERPFVAASQWPARTLLACKRDVLPLPPASEDPDQFRRKISGITHFAFNPQLERLHGLARNAASVSDLYEPIAIRPGGVVLKLRSDHK